MRHYTHAARAAAFIALCALLSAQNAAAHGVVGKRFFPATMAFDDPLPADEFGITYSNLSPAPDADGEDVDFEYSKRLTDKLSVSIGKGWAREREGGVTAKGFGNLETGLKYRLLADPEHETALSAGVDVEWGGTGDDEIGAEHVTHVTPALFFGKGFGDASADWLKPFAVTGNLGYDLPTKKREDGVDIPEALTYGVSLQYSLPYLRQNVHDYGWGDFLGRLTPIVEAQFETPVARRGDERTTGTIRPGVLWTGRRVQVGAEAIVPINNESGDGLGFALQLHLFLDDMFPHSIGRPLFGGAR